MLPILIGSKALEYYFEAQMKSNNICARDTDILCTIQEAKDIIFEADSKKSKNICRFEDVVVDISIISTESDKMIYKFLNQNKEKQNIIKIAGKIEVIVAPKELLYIIKKSHIHRVVRSTQRASLNAEIWHKHMKQYTFMRKLMDCRKVDALIYGDKLYGNPVDGLESMLKTIFLTRFSETNNREHDTQISMDKDLTEFFNDNVPRCIEHDDLHKCVSKLYRDTDEQLFTKFQKDKSRACLDYDLYFNGASEDRRQLFREEIAVLFLERKVLPVLTDCYIKTKTLFNGFNEPDKKEEFNEIISHFCTNLCGSGHSWLRQYCLDSYESYKYDTQNYSLNSLYEIAYDITGINKKRELVCDNIDSFNNLELSAENEKLSKIISKLQKNKTREKVEIGDNASTAINLSAFEICVDNGTSLTSTDVAVFCANDSVVKYIDLIKNESDIIVDENCGALYAISKNIGCVYTSETDSWVIFRLICTKNNDANTSNDVSDDEIEDEELWGPLTDPKKVEAELKTSNVTKLKISVVTLENDGIREYDKLYSKSYAVYFYESSFCSYNERREETDHYLSQYGNCPSYLSNFIEQFARQLVGIPEDTYDSKNSYEDCFHQAY